MRIGLVYRASNHSKLYTHDTKLMQKIHKIIDDEVDVEVISPSSINFHFPKCRSNIDLICSMTRDSFMLAALQVFEAMGVRVINNVNSVRTVLNKCLTYLLLIKNNIQVPETHFLPRFENQDEESFLKKPAFDGGLITEPIPLLEQKRIHSNICIKGYVCGDKLLGFSGLPDNQKYSNKGLDDIVLRCGRILNLEIYNVELILHQSDNTPYVIDVNDFPSFRFINSAANRIAEYILRKGRDH